MVKKKKKEKIDCTKSELISYLRPIAKLYGMTAHFVKLSPLIGGYANLDGSFYVNVCNTNIYIATTFFHELAHEINRVEGKFKIYHNDDSWEHEDTRRALKRTAWRAEVFTDKRGKELMDFWLPEHHYRIVYKGEGVKKWLREHLKDVE